ncbi:host attachment family protein [Roseomonas sp. OT10]|uniref:host attachment family protein n=1 Tax=Roseomonas cutis TaxID=2897332 RepID=UPI001E2A64BF|nr:host attachment family protein [Roseomonas sp. OT10]UFN49548.1 host attachment family protein [Roseomonas sp. OT10]
MAELIPHNALIVVADGGKALLLRNAGRGLEVTLREEERLSPNPDGQGPSGSRPDEQSPKETGEATFAKEIAQSLYALKTRNAFEALVLVADPQTLGQIRDALHKTVEASVVQSIPKNLTNHTLPEIAAALG